MSCILHARAGACTCTARPSLHLLPPVSPLVRRMYGMCQRAGWDHSALGNWRVTQASILASRQRQRSQNTAWKQSCLMPCTHSAAQVTAATLCASTARGCASKRLCFRVHRCTAHAPRSGKAACPPKLQSALGDVTEHEDHLWRCCAPHTQARAPCAASCACRAGR